MSLVLNEEQTMLRDNARDFVTSRAPVKHLRALRDSDEADGFSRDVWKEMVDLGWPAIPFPESCGGLGLGYRELGIIMEECGRMLVPTPLLASVVLGGGAVLAGGTEAQKQAMLPGVCDGSLLLTLAFQERSRFHRYPATTRATPTAGGFSITGEKCFVIDGHVADHIVVSARTSGDGEGREGVSLFVVDPGAKGLTIERTRMVDSRNVARIVLDGVEVSKDALIGTLDSGSDVLDPVLDQATACLSAELVGLSDQAFETTVEYLKTRVQFDVLIGTFQALQHRAVDMFCELELARSITADALNAIDEGRDDVAAMASAAKARCSDLSRKVTREAVQMHGGIGMTDEHDIGFYMKRGATAELALGDSAHHRSRFATLKGY